MIVPFLSLLKMSISGSRMIFEGVRWVGMCVCVRGEGGGGGGGGGRGC